MAGPVVQNVVGGRRAGEGGVPAVIAPGLLRVEVLIVIPEVADKPEQWSATTIWWLAASVSSLNPVSTGWGRGLPGTQRPVTADGRRAEVLPLEGGHEAGRSQGQGHGIGHWSPLFC